MSYIDMKKKSSGMLVAILAQEVRSWLKHSAFQRSCRANRREALAKKRSCSLLSMPTANRSLLLLVVAACAENTTRSDLSNARFYPYVWPHAGQTCYFRCKDAGFCCGSSASGNQMISCAQACVMRSRGTPEDELIKAGGLCQRTSSSGCSLDVNGYSYSFCETCFDVTDKCPHGVESTADCQYGARTWTMYLMTTKPTVNAEGCDCAWIPHDNCKSQDFCAQACRKANPWGTCGMGDTEGASLFP
eukprot:s326_g57.t1